MPRRTPLSTKQRKAQLQEKRAIKRGDIEKPTSDARAGPSNHRRPGGRSQAYLRAQARSDDPNVAAAAMNASAKIESSKKLQSAFRKVSPEFLARWKTKASEEVLLRPIPSEKKYLPIEMIEQPHSDELTTPKRPKWRFDMTKREVERNEEGMFEKWRQETEERVDTWRNPQLDITSEVKDDLETAPAGATNESLLRSPTFYEQNLEVWRQLWRVTEVSSVLLVLLDSRCPPLHYPPSLHTYLSSQRPPRKVILVLTKTDIAGVDRVDRWKLWLKDRYPDAKIVGVESYRLQPGRGSRVRHVPHIPPQYLSELIDAMELSHKELLEPPENIKDIPEKLEKWRPRVRREVNWDVVRKGESIALKPGDVATTGPISEREQEKGGEGEEGDGSGDEGALTTAAVDQEALTIGLIGQPNVGKSSLLNALFGTIKVKASRTPGKTKHFQTLFWSPEIRLVDCPGLVLPNLVPMELQVLAGILPISQISSIPSCIYFASNMLPLEQIFSLRHPSEDEAEVEDKRTWRGGVRPSTVTNKKRGWTAMDILVAYANLRGWVTAKGGRPDINRAGNAMLRYLAEGKVRWAFEPPMTESTATATGGDGRGLWIPKENEAEIESDTEESEEDQSGEDGMETSPKDEEPGEGGSDTYSPNDVETARTAVRGGGVRIGGMFGALTLEEESAESDDEDDSG